MGRLWALREARLSADARSLGAYAVVRLFGEGREEGFPRSAVSAPRGQSACRGRPRAVGRAARPRGGTPRLPPALSCEPGMGEEKVGAWGSEPEVGAEAGPLGLGLPALMLGIWGQPLGRDEFPGCPGGLDSIPKALSKQSLPETPS